MNANSNPSQASRFSTSARSQLTWRMLVMIVLVAWLSMSAFIDFVLMPGLYSAGMMGDPAFAMAGHLIFSIFNRFELMAGAFVLTGCLLLWAEPSGNTRSHTHWLNWLCAASLVVIPLIYAYGLTPYMSGLGMQLDLSAAPEMAAGMVPMHLIYWGIEGLKWVASLLLLNQVWLRNSLPSTLGSRNSTPPAHG